MRRGLLIPVGGAPEVIEADDFDGATFRTLFQWDRVAAVALPTPRAYKPRMEMFFAPDSTEAENTTATALAGPNIGIFSPVRGPAVVVVRKRDEPADLALDDMHALALAVVAAEMGLPAPR